MIIYANFKEMEGCGSDLSQYGSQAFAWTDYTKEGNETLRIAVLQPIF
jgi:hypothetical protein